MRTVQSSLALRGLLAATLFAAGCSGASSTSDDAESGEDALVSSAPRPFDVARERDTATKSFTTATGVVEVCIVPKHFAEDGFTKGDGKKEAKLCSVDFDAAVGAEGVLPGALLPKNNSTNPATNVMLVDAQHGRAAIETSAEANKAESSADKLGRMKSSLDESRFGRTASYAPSIVGYYATSRLLGNIAEVTPAVWRTLDVKRHAKVAALGAQLPLSVSRIVKTLWSSFLVTDRAEQKSQLTYTTDGAQLYTAFIPSVSGDAKDKTIDTAEVLRASPQWKRLVDGRPLPASASLKDAVQTIIPMQGIGEMLVLDAIMLQADRLSGDNVSYVPMMYFKAADGSIDHVKKNDFSAADAAAHPDAVEVKKLYLNDVDAGLAFNNAQGFQGGREYGLLRQVAHLSPKLYAKIAALKAAAAAGPLEAFAKSEWRYTDRDWFRYKTMLDAVGTLLHDRCTSKALVLDLDVDKHLAGADLAPGEGCDGP